MTTRSALPRQRNRHPWQNLHVWETASDRLIIAARKWVNAPTKATIVNQFYFYIDWCVGERGHLFLLRQIISHPCWRATWSHFRHSRGWYAQYSKNWQLYYSRQTHKLLSIKLNSQPDRCIANYPTEKRVGDYHFSVWDFKVCVCLNQDHSFCCSQADCQEAKFDKETCPDLQLDSRIIMLWGESRKQQKEIAEKSIAHFLLFCIGILMFAEIKADET